jgi:hypothetical protein
MSFLKKLFSPSLAADPNVFWVAVRCNRCGEIIQARINLQNDLSLDYEAGDKPMYYCRKTLMGEGHCFQRVQVELTFDADKRLLDRRVSGGQFVDGK